MSVLFPQAVLTTAYFPPVEYFFAIASSGKVLIEANENWQKQSYRSRCHIYSAAGPEVLSVPIVRAGGEKIPVRDARIDYGEPWLQHHERAMTAAYNNSAFFEYYIDELFAILDRREPFLFDLNMRLLESLLHMAGIRADISLTEEWLPDYAEGDFRERIQPKWRGESLLSEHRADRPYFQVFGAADTSQKGPGPASFIPNLSILDLLCAEGPESISFLKI